VSIDFTVVIPTYRRHKELVEAIASVLDQPGVTLEVLVVDDSPEESARETVESIRDIRVNYFSNPKATGGVPSVVRNLAWPRAKGSFVHFLDDDDIVPSGHYTAVKSSFSRHSDVGLVFGRIEPFGDGPAWQMEHERRYFAEAARNASVCQRLGPKWAFTAHMLFDRPVLVCSAGVVRRECIARVGGFDPMIRLMEDADFYARVMREFGAYFMDTVSLRYRIGTPSLMHSPNPDEMQLRDQRVGRRLMQAKYRRERGSVEFYALAALARTVLRGLKYRCSRTGATPCRDLDKIEARGQL
jgi:glycosyltransferase involved in cell wall biosynthesis